MNSEIITARHRQELLTWFFETYRNSFYGVQFDNFRVTCHRRDVDQASVTIRDNDDYLLFEVDRFRSEPWTIGNLPDEEWEVLETILQKMGHHRHRYINEMLPWQINERQARKDAIERFNKTGHATPAAKRKMNTLRLVGILCVNISCIGFLILLTHLWLHPSKHTDGLFTVALLGLITTAAISTLTAHIWMKPKSPLKKVE